MCWTDFPHPVQFHSSKDRIVQDRPRSSCDGLFFAKRIWSGNKPVCKNLWAWFLQNATNPLPVSRFQTWLPFNFTDCPDHIGQNQPGSIGVFAHVKSFHYIATSTGISVLLKLDHSTAQVRSFHCIAISVLLKLDHSTGQVRSFHCSSQIIPLLKSDHLTAQVRSFHWSS